MGGLFPLYNLLTLCHSSKEFTGNLASILPEETSGLSITFQSGSYTGFLSLNPNPYGKEKTETGLIQYACLGRVEEFVHIQEANESLLILYLA